MITGDQIIEALLKEDQTPLRNFLNDHVGSVWPLILCATNIDWLENDPRLEPLREVLRRDGIVLVNPQTYRAAYETGGLDGLLGIVGHEVGLIPFTTIFSCVFRLPIAVCVEIFHQLDRASDGLQSSPEADDSFLSAIKDQH